MLIAALLFFVSIQKTSSAQLLEEQSQILQTCIDLTELQQYFPKMEDDSDQKLHILNFPVEFSGSLNVSKFNQPVFFCSREEIRNANPDAFIAFTVFDVSDETASIEFEITYDRLTETSGFLKGNLSLVKESGTWVKSNLSLNNL